MLLCQSIPRQEGAAGWGTAEAKRETGFHMVNAGSREEGSKGNFFYIMSYS